MYLTRCAECAHINPPSSLYCNACGSRMQAILCPYCSAVNDPAQARCRKCEAALGNAPAATAESVRSIKVAPAPAPPPPRASVAALRVPRSEARVFPVLRDELAPRVFAVKADPDGSVYLACRSEAETVADLLACQTQAQPAADAPSVLAGPAEQEPVRPRADVGPFAAHPPAANAHHVDPAADFDVAPPAVAVPAGGAAARRSATAMIGVALAAAVAGGGYYVYRQPPEIRLTMLPEAGAGAGVRAPAVETLPQSAQALPAAPVAAPTAGAAPVPVAIDLTPRAPMAQSVVPVDAVALPPPRSAAPAIAQAPAPPARRVRPPSPSPAAVVAAPALPREGVATTAGDRQPAPVGGPCTAPIAALGLCSPESPPRRP